MQIVGSLSGRLCKSAAIKFTDVASTGRCTQQSKHGTVFQEVGGSTSALRGFTLATGGRSEWRRPCRRRQLLLSEATAKERQGGRGILFDQERMEERERERERVWNWRLVRIGRPFGGCARSAGRRPKSGSLQKGPDPKKQQQPKGNWPRALSAHAHTHTTTHQRKGENERKSG